EGGGGLVGGVVQQGRDRVVARRQRGAVFADAVLGRQETCEQRGVRRQRQRRRRPRRREPNARRGKPIEPGRDAGAHTIRAQRVDRDEQHVRTRRRGLRWLRPPARDRQRRGHTGVQKRSA